MAALVGLALVAGVVVAGTGPASAETFASKINAKTSLYDCTADRPACTTAIGTAASGTKARMVCFEDGRQVAGITYSRWLFVRLSTGAEGYVKAERVSSQTKVSGCADAKASNEIRGVIAANWALAHLHTTSCSSTKANTLCPTTAEKQRLNKTWGQSLTWTQGNWSGDCISFAALAWYQAGKTIPIKNARQVYDVYKQSIHKDKRPPRGALVFWDAWSGGKNYGHVAISLGNGRVVGTKGWDSKTQPIRSEAIWSTSYLGWVMP